VLSRVFQESQKTAEYLQSTVNHKSTYISQGSAATRLRSGGIMNDLFLANFLLNVLVKELFFLNQGKTPGNSKITTRSSATA